MQLSLRYGDIHTYCRQNLANLVKIPVQTNTRLIAENIKARQVTQPYRASLPKE